MPRRSLWNLRYRKSDAKLQLPLSSSKHKKHHVCCDEESSIFKICDNTAGQIFGCEGEYKKRIIEMDCKSKILFELVKAYNEKPKSHNRQNITVRNINVKASPLFSRMRVWILKYPVWMVILFYLAIFVVVNVIFATLWYIPTDGCCGGGSDNSNTTMTYTETLNFAIQTSTTLGYGGNEPVGIYSNILVALNFFVSLTLHALFAGVIFLKFVTPSAKFEFSNLMTLSNVNGLPCLELRVGNADGSNMVLQEITARLNFMYVIHYKDDLGQPREMRSMQEVKLLVDWRYELKEVWTLRHVLDEKSPLFGVLGVSGLQDDINLFRITVNGTQAVTNMHVSASWEYQLQDIMIGYRFQDQIGWDEEKKGLIIDYSKMNEIVPHPVWYPVQNVTKKSTNSSSTTIDEEAPPPRRASSSQQLGTSDERNDKQDSTDD